MVGQYTPLFFLESNSYNARLSYSTNYRTAPRSQNFIKSDYYLKNIERQKSFQELCL